MGTVAVRVECCHWDVIAIPNGPISKARCKYCGREKEYANFKWPDYNSKPMKKPAIEDQQEMIYDG